MARAVETRVQCARLPLLQQYIHSALRLSAYRDHSCIARSLSQMDEEAPNGPTFRAKKRQKVYRRRADSDDADEPTITATAQAQSITNQASTPGDEDVNPVRIQRKLAAKKHGIAFSSTESRRDAERDTEVEKALVLAQVERGQDAPGADRFVRPTGKVAVTEDRHMYVLSTMNFQGVMEWN